MPNEPIDTTLKARLEEAANPQALPPEAQVAAELRLLVEEFWQALGRQQEWFERPQKVDDYVYKMRTQSGFIFDDSFWETFQGFPFKICHVAYYGPERLEDADRRQDTGVSELRFGMSTAG